MSSVLPLLATLGGFASVAIAADSVPTDFETHLPQTSAKCVSPSTDAPSVLAPTLVATGEFWSNQHGGAQTGERWNTLVNLGLTVDLEKLGAPHGSQLVGQVFWVKNQNEETDMSALTGAFNPVSGFHAGDQLRVFDLYYRQSWNNDAYVVKFGQLAIDCDFMGSDYAALFANSSFGAMPSQVATPLAATAGNTPAFPVYAVASPGIYFAARVNDSFSWQLGFYHGGPGPDEKKNHGFDWERGTTAGPVAFIETAFTGKLAGHASTVRIGGDYHSGKFDDFSALNEGETDATVRGLYSFYVGHDFVFSADAKDKPVFAAFWRAGLSPQQDRSVVRTYTDAGFNWFGPIASRPDDVAGVAVSCTEFGREYRTYSGVDVLARHETTVELTYRAQLTSHWALQADLQLLGHPADEAATNNHATATVVGLRTELSF